MDTAGCRDELKFSKEAHSQFHVFSPGASGSHPRHWHFYQRRLTVKLNACRPLVKTVPRQFKSNLPVQADTLSHFPNMNLRASASWGFLLFFFRLNMARADYSGPCGSV